MNNKKSPVSQAGDIDMDSQAHVFSSPRRMTDRDLRDFSSCFASVRSIALSEPGQSHDLKQM